MPARFWGEVVTTTVFLLNRAPTKALSGKTPFEAYHSHKSAVVFFKTFGWVSFIKNKHPGLKKLDDRSAPMVFIGYSEGAKAYQMLELDTERIHVSHDVVFDESRGWEWNTAASGGDSVEQREFTVRFFTARPPVDNGDGAEPEEGELPPPPVQEAPLPVLGTPPPVEQQAPEFVTPIKDDEDRLDAFHNESPVRYRRMDSVIDNDLPVTGQAQRILPQRRHGRPRRVQEELQFVTGGSEPRSFAEAE
jgi:hypothetical protein